MKISQGDKNIGDYNVLDANGNKVTMVASFDDDTKMAEFFIQNKLPDGTISVACCYDDKGGKKLAMISAHCPGFKLVKKT